MGVDEKVEFEAVQRKAITKNALKEQVKRIERQVEMVQHQHPDHDPKVQQLQDELIASRTYITSGFENLHSYGGTGSVLVTQSSKLVSVLLVESKGELCTLDSDYLMRLWALETGK